MNRIAQISAFILSALLALPAAAIDEGGGGGEVTRHAPSAPPKTLFTPLEQARGAVREERFEVAMHRLQRIVRNEPMNADAWNLLGFSYRMLGDLDRSGAAYLQVLAIDPNHTGALEYQGELFLTQGNIAGAKANLARLHDLCGACEAAEDLEQALDAVGA